MKLWQDKTVVTALKGILEAYPYLEYDEDETKRPLTYDKEGSLKVKITDSSKKSTSIGNKIASELSKNTGRKFICPTNYLSQSKYLTIKELPKKTDSRDSKVAPTQKEAK